MKKVGKGMLKKPAPGFLDKAKDKAPDKMPGKVPGSFKRGK